MYIYIKTQQINILVMHHTCIATAGQKRAVLLLCETTLPLALETVRVVSPVYEVGFSPPARLTCV